MSSPDVKAVVFDLGGVLIDWNPRHLYRKLLPSEEEVERFLTDVTTLEWNAQQDAGRSWGEAVEILSQEFPEHRDLIAAYRERWDEMLGGQIDESVAILTALRSAGMPLYALTNWSAETFPIALERFDWLSWFDGIVVSGQERIAKPDEKIYRILLQRYGLDPEATAFVDDRPENVEAAAGVGMVGLHFTTPDQLRTDLNHLLPSC